MSNLDLSGLASTALLPFFWVQINGDAPVTYSAALNDGAIPFSAFLQAFMAANPTTISLASAATIL